MAGVFTLPACQRHTQPGLCVPGQRDASTERNDMRCPTPTNWHGRGGGRRLRGREGGAGGAVKLGFCKRRPGVTPMESMSSMEASFSRTGQRPRLVGFHSRIRLRRLHPLLHSGPWAPGETPGLSLPLRRSVAFGIMLGTKTTRK